MDIKGHIYCLFERSGTFKRAFERLGFVAFDFDICDTEHVERPMDLFLQIHKAFERQPSLFDAMTPDDLILAFFPCIEFASGKQLIHSDAHPNYAKLDYHALFSKLIQLNLLRAESYNLLLKLVGVAKERSLRLIIENPWQCGSFLRTSTIFEKPTFVDWNRQRRGDFFVKPTAYWFINCEPTYGESFATPRKKMRVLSLPRGDLGRSLISDEYATNFIKDFVLGLSTSHNLFDRDL